MNAAELVAALEEAGVRLRVRGERLDVEAASEPPRPLLDELTREKAAVLSFLRESEAPPPPVVVKDRRAPEPEAPASSPAAPQIISSRSFSNGEIALASGAVPVRIERTHDPLAALTADYIALARRYGYTR